MAWLTPTTLANFFDSRTIAELSVDSDAPADPVVADVAVVQAHLDAAQQTIEAAAGVGNRFTPPFLAAEVGELLGLLQARLAFFSLSNRRGKNVEEDHKFVIEQALTTVKDIQNGGVIPGLLTEASANQALQVKNYSPTANERLDRELISDVSGFFPTTGVA